MFCFNKNNVFPAEAEYYYFSADFRLKYSCEYFQSTAYDMFV